MSRLVRRVLAVVLIAVAGLGELIFGGGNVAMCLGPLNVTPIQCAKVTGIVPTTPIAVPLFALAVAVGAMLLAPILLAAAIDGTIRENVAEMAVAVRRAHLGADHAVRGVAQLSDVGGLNRLGEARPAASRFVFVGGGEQRLARHDVDVDARLLVVEIFAGSGHLGAAVLGDAALLRRELRYGFRALPVRLHFLLLEGGREGYRIYRKKAPPRQPYAAMLVAQAVTLSPTVRR
jgi:hypothetical protein